MEGRLRGLARALALAAALSAGGCCNLRPPISGPDADVGPREREMAALSFVAYTGELLRGSDAEIEAALAPCLAAQLASQPLLAGRWSLAWGPAVSHLLPAPGPADNMMFAVRGSDGSVVVAIRGTNGTEPWGWLFEDLSVETQVPWSHASPAGLSPRISLGTDRGLRALTSMAPGGRTLADFLRGETAAGMTRLAVTGHSLGGALAPALALWLADARSSWDPGSRVAISVVPLAGATSGNRDFATYYGQVLGGTTVRIHNRYDVVPLAWDSRTMLLGPGLYLPDIPPPPGTCALAKRASRKFEPLAYHQILDDAPSIPGSVHGGEPRYGEQIGWQHVCGYQCGLGIAADLAPVPLDCAGAVTARCDCPVAAP